MYAHVLHQSPTGTLHIGNVRTALFAWLYARKHQGQFILRIEDTDKERSTEESAQSILTELEWLGLNYDEGPYFQSTRQAHYKAAAERLLAEGKAYYCYYTKEELAERAADFSNKGSAVRSYDDEYSNRTEPRPGVEPTIRIKTPNIGTTSFDDCVHGHTEIENEQLSDIIIMRSDGTPTYNFAVVIDDTDMQITHVLRGDDHLQNTFQQINLLKHLDATIPTYAHLPMVLREDGHRLSKRDYVAGIVNYREQGYLPHALLNYLVRLGWSKGNQEIFAIDELITHFDLPAIHKSAAALNTEKLDWLNAHYLCEMPISELSRTVGNRLVEQGVQIKQTPPLDDIVAEMRPRYKTLLTLAKGLLFIYKTPDYDIDAAKNYEDLNTLELLNALLEYIQQIDDWDTEKLKIALSDFSGKHGIKIGMVGKPLRYVLTAGAPSPALGHVMMWIGKEECIARITNFIALHQ